MNNRILLIETATDVCSVAVSEGNEILSSGHITEARSQASQLAPLIQDTVSRAGMQISGLAAVAVSSGPGSYTGLRVGVSTAKGICFGAGIPLIGIETLTAIACGTLKTGAAQEDPDGTVIIPMIDARRMEVYTALYDSSAQRISETEAVVLTPDTFSGTLKNTAASYSQETEPPNMRICSRSNTRTNASSCPPVPKPQTWPPQPSWP